MITVQYVTSLRMVLIVIGQPSALMLCRMTDNLGGQGQGDNPVLATIKCSRDIHAVVQLAPGAAQK